MNINELYSLIRNGDKTAEKHLFDKLNERFRVILQHKVMNAEDADDVLQNSLMTIAGKYREIEFEVSFSAWAYKVLELNILAHYRKKGSERKRFGKIPENSDSSTAITPDPELKRRLLDCLRKLNESNIRHARILNFSYQGYDMDQICEKLNTTKTAAYILLSRARAKLKECINTGSFDYEMP